jgi:hypothetical protein
LAFFVGTRAVDRRGDWAFVCAGHRQYEEPVNVAFLRRRFQNALSFKSVPTVTESVCSNGASAVT